MAFFWEGNTGQISSPEQAARKRAVAQALLSQSGSGANNWGEGLARVAQALTGTVLEGRVSDAEAAGQERASALFSDLASGANPDSIIAALTSPDAAWATPAQSSIASALLQSGLERQDPMYQMGLEKAALELEALRNPAAPKPVFEGGQWWDIGSGMPTALTQITPEPTSLMTNIEAAGLVPGTPEYVEAILSSIAPAQTNITVGSQGQQFANAPFGQDYRRNPDGTVWVDPATGLPEIVQIPNGPQDIEAQALTDKSALSSGRQDTSSDTVLNAATEARRIAGLPGNTGWTGAVWRLSPFSDASELQRQIGVLRSNATIENLTAMRQASPTGGALGSVTEKEGAMLADAAGALDPDSPNFNTQLDNYERTLFKIIHGPTEGQRIFEETRQNATPAPSTAPAPAAATGGIDYNAAEPPANWGGDKALWRYMSPEDRALW